MRSAALHTVWLFALLVSCSGDQSLRIHAQAAHATRSVLVRVSHSIREVRIERQEEAVVASETRNEARGRVEEIRIAWAPIVAGYNMLAEAHDTWVAALLAAMFGEDGDVPTEAWIRLAGEVVHLWSAVATLGETVSLDIPAPPPLLLRLVGAP